MAPEIMTDSRNTSGYGGHVDVYSFGILMWTCFVRKKPYSTDEAHRKMNLWSMRDAILDGMRPDVDLELLDEAPTSAIRLMEQCWNPDFKARPDFEEIQTRLKKLADRISEGRPRGLTHKASRSQLLKASSAAAHERAVVDSFGFDASEFVQEERFSEAPKVGFAENPMFKSQLTRTGEGNKPSTGGGPFTDPSAIAINKTQSSDV
jgi:hypothetical protein